MTDESQAPDAGGVPPRIELDGKTFELTEALPIVEIGEPLRIEFHYEPEAPGVVFLWGTVSRIYIDPKTALAVVGFAFEGADPEAVSFELHLPQEVAAGYPIGHRERFRISIE